jgi:hypothetical protein
MKVEPAQTFDEFLDTADIVLLQFGESVGKAPGRAPSSGRSPRSRSNGVKTL